MTPIVDIILPVYRDLEATERAIRSVLTSHNQQPWHLIVINDASPDAEMPAMLAALCDGNPSITLLTNEQNLGFVGTVNRGMKLHDDRDVVLLNSDTAACNDWLDRLTAHAADDVASITPFSNNATICSTPRIDIANPDLTDPLAQTAALDAVHARANAGASVEIPTGVGFCMWMSRKAMQEAGIFDEEAFGKGYGEEVDWCQRTALMGYRHLLACDVFVYHEGGVSFSESAQALKDRAQGIIRKRYPRYEANVSDWVQRDPALPFRLAAIAERYHSNQTPVIVHLSHFLGGGTEKHVRELAYFAQTAKHLIMHPDPSGGMRLKSLEEADGVDVLFSLSEGMVALQDLLYGFGITRFHLHHLIGFDDALLKRFILTTGIPFDLTIHDYYLICPQIFLIDEKGNYCGEPDAESCNRCIKHRPRYNAKDISVWRSDHQWWFEHAARVITPSMDVAARLKRYHPEANFVVMPHPETIEAAPPAPPALSEGEPLRIAIIGALSIHKGVLALIDVMKAAAKASQHIEISHFGMVGDKNPPRRCGSVSFHSHGLYSEEELPSLLADANPHLIWFPTHCPETYSYTLSHAFRYGAPLLTPAIGAFPERTAGRAWVFTFSVDASAEDMALQLAAIREQLIAASAPPPSLFASGPLPAPLQDYEHNYITHSPSAPAIARSDDRRVIGWITQDAMQPDAHEKTRILQPLTHPAISDTIRLQPLSYGEAFHADIDALLLCNTAICSTYMLSKLLSHARTRGIPVIYDIDDDLLSIDASHPEHFKYKPLTKGIQFLVTHADRVTVPTLALANRVAAYRSAALPPALILPNYFDERLAPLPSAEAIAESQQTQPLRVLYVSAHSQQPDFDAIAPAIRPILSRHGAQLTTIGLSHPPSWSTNLDYPADCAAQWLSERHREQPWHIGIAPLRETPVNLCKSGGEFLTYSALGLAGIYANLPVFSDIAAHGETGWLADASAPDSWAQALDELLSDAAQRTRIAQQATASLQSRHTLASDAAFWVPVWLRALREQGNHASPIIAPPLAASAQELMQSSPRKNPLKRFIKGLIHRCASYGLLRAIWRNTPSPLKKQVRQIIHRKLTH